MDLTILYTMLTAVLVVGIGSLSAIYILGRKNII